MTCACTALEWCETCSSAFLRGATTGPVGGDGKWTEHPEAYALAYPGADPANPEPLPKNVAYRLSVVDPYAAHREREADARKFWTEELGLAKRWRDQAAARVAKCEDELRRLG